MRVLVGAALVLLLMGCATVSDKRTAYCDNASPVQRAVLYALVTNAGVPLPPGGACADLLEVLVDAGIDSPSSQ